MRDGGDTPRQAVTGLDPLDATFVWPTDWVYERADAGTVDPATAVELEPLASLSESSIWRRQHDFFRSQGVAAWTTGGVPQYVTTNRYLADQYAQVLVAWLRDGARRRPDAPLTILELGAGSGRFAFHVVQRLAALVDGSDLAGVSWRYVMTDVSEASVAAWRAHGSFAPYLARGTLDAARFDVAAPGDLDLDLGRGPVAVIANYVFDSVPHDCFAVDADGGLREALLGAARAGTPPAGGEADVASAEGGPEVLGPLLLRGAWRRVTGSRFAERATNELLDGYRRDLAPGSVFTIPTTALCCLAHLRREADDDLLVLMTDMGPTGLEQIDGRPLPTFNGHGSFSLPLNFHALGRATGATVLRASVPRKHIELVGLRFGVDDEQGRTVASAFRDVVDGLGPSGFLDMERALHLAFAGFSLDELLAAIRWARHDHVVFVQAMPALLKRLEGTELDPADADALQDVLDRVWDGYFFIGEAEDVAFKIGRVLLAAGRPEAALVHFERSRSQHGDRASTMHEIARAREAVEHAVGPTRRRGAR